MKISIGTKIKDGPWGGGNLFAINLRNFLEKEGHEVVYDLVDEDIDIILITEPRRTSESSAFTSTEVKNYLRYIKFDTLVVHRINECDERKNTNFVNKYLMYANKVADATVFVSTWLKDLYISHGLPSKNLNVILLKTLVILLEEKILYLRMILLEIVDTLIFQHFLFIH